jgi:hypothetical protein
MRGDALRRRSRRLSAGLLGLMLLLAGCTYSDREPGLFGPSPSLTQTRPPAPRVPSIADIPVLGEAIYPATDPFDISVRIAVHAVRRIRDGTVLDWSLTPLAGPQANPGDQLFLDLDITEQFDVSLIDTAASRVYRPLTDRRSADCLCIPASLVGRTAVVNRPRLLQTAFPLLPASTRYVEVNIGTVPIFPRVPVTPAGQVQTAPTEVDLARPAEPASVGTWAPQFDYPTGQSFVYDVDAVLVSGSYTSLVWTIRARDSGPGVIGTAQPQIRRAGSRSALRPLTAMTTAGSEKTVRCLCPDLANLSGRLSQGGDHLTVVINYPGLPRGTTSVDVLFPGLQPLVGIGVTPAPDGAFRAGASEPVDVGTWSYPWDRPQAGWSLLRWPTPVPADAGSNRFRSRVDRLIR